MASIRAPERLHERIFGRGWLPHDLDDPAIHLAFEVAEQRLKGVAIAPREAEKQSAVRLVEHLYRVLPGESREGSVMSRRPT
jgi:hypothetical protein